MKIQWLGHACFLMTTSANLRILTDPYDSSIGLKLPFVSADIVTTSHGHFDHGAVSEVHGTPKVVNSLEGLDVGKAKIRGVASYHDEQKGAERGRNIIYVFEIIENGETFTLCHAGDLGHTLTPEIIERIGGVDVLMLPVGGTYTVDAAGAWKVVEQISPRIVLPMHYRIRGLKVNVGGVEKFIEGRKDVSRLRELSLSRRRDLPIDTQVILLERSELS
jgi:L-ascorbate metabolism protein UlaG (beta-lactamase superfamily)